MPKLVFSMYQNSEEVSFNANEEIDLPVKRKASRKTSNASFFYFFNLGCQQNVRSRLKMNLSQETQINGDLPFTNNLIHKNPSQLHHTIWLRYELIPDVTLTRKYSHPFWQLLVLITELSSFHSENFSTWHKFNYNPQFSSISLKHKTYVGVLDTSGVEFCTR